jgi:hypothetical protein
MVATLASCIVKSFYGVIRGSMEHALTVAPALVLREGTANGCESSIPGARVTVVERLHRADAAPLPHSA